MSKTIFITGATAGIGEASQSAEGFDGSDTSFRVFGGYAFNPHVGQSSSWQKLTKMFGFKAYRAKLGERIFEVIDADDMNVVIACIVHR